MSDNWNKFLESLLLVWIKRSTGVGCSSHIIFSDKFLKAWYSWAFFNPEGSLKAKEFTHGSMNEMSCISAGVEISFAVVSDWHGVNSLPVGILVYFVIPPQNRILVRSMNYSSVQCFKGTWCHLQCKSTKVLAIINRTLKPSKVIVLCSWGKHFTVIRPLSIKGYKWVQVNFQGSLMKCRWVGGYLA